MSTLVGSREPPAAWHVPPAKPLDEAAWQGWLAKGRKHDRRGIAARFTALRWLSIVTLLAAAGFWSQLESFMVVVKCVVSVGAFAAMLQAFQMRQAVFALLFAALTLIYFPITPALSLSGDSQRVLLLLSTVPFAASLAWGSRTLAHNH
jgi:lysylphosphatidylglycerol synthetase-like protein (DUF2156 family)